MATHNILTTFGNFRGTLVGMIGDEPILKWNDNPATSPARWRVAAVPVDGGDPVLLSGQPTVGTVTPVGVFGGRVACGHARPWEYAGGFVLADGGAVPLERPVGVRGFYLGFAHEGGVFGSAYGVGGIHWDWDGRVVEVRPSGFRHPLSEIVVPTPAGYTSFVARAASVDERYVAGVGINLNAPTRAEMQKALMIDTATDTVAPLADVLGVAADATGLQFLAGGEIVCVAQSSPSTQQVVRVSGWEA